MPRFEKLTGEFEIATGADGDRVTWRFGRTAETDREFTAADDAGRSRPQVRTMMPAMLGALLGWEGVLDASGRSVAYSQEAFYEYIPPAMRLELLGRWTRHMRGEWQAGPDADGSAKEARAEVAPPGATGEPEAGRVARSVGDAAEDLLPGSRRPTHPEPFARDWQSDTAAPPADALPGGVGVVPSEQDAVGQVATAATGREGGQLVAPASGNADEPTESVGTPAVSSGAPPDPLSEPEPVPGSSPGDALDVTVEQASLPVLSAEETTVPVHAPPGGDHLGSGITNTPPADTLETRNPEPETSSLLDDPDLDMDWRLEDVVEAMYRWNQLAETYEPLF